MLYLVAKAGLTRGVTWSLQHGRTIVGRDSAADIVLGDSLVSRQHCVITCENNSVRISDLGAQNGVLVNGVPRSEAAIHPGDEIAIGRVVLLLSKADPAASLPSPDVLGETTRLSLERASFLRPLPGTEVATVVDLHTLLQAAHRLAAAVDAAEFWSLIHLVLTQHLQPQSLWLGERVHEDWEPRPKGMVAVKDALHPSKEDLHTLAVAGEGRLAPISDSRDSDWVLSAPMVHQGHVVGCAALTFQNAIPNGQEALDFLVSLFSLAAPIYLGLQRREQLEKEVKVWQASSRKRVEFLGKSEMIRTLRDEVRQAAACDSPVFIRGETGTGKELIAQMLHACSRRASERFVAMNCAAIPAHLFESELFGHERGAFTGAHQRRTGLVELSDRGTLFLDEVGDLSPENQARLLRVLETRKLRRVGGNKEIDSDFRLITATNSDLAARVAMGAFRSDLYFRLRVIEILAPPLRAHREDIPELAEHFLEAARLGAHRVVHGFSDGAIEYLQAQSWPGNVRELKHAVEAAASLSPDGWIGEETLRRVVHVLDASPFAPVPLADVERRHILGTLEYCGGRVIEAARMLGIGKTSLYEKLAKYRDDPSGDAQ